MKDKVKSDLSKKRGYYNNGKLKKGKAFLAGKYGCTIEVIEEAIAELRTEARILETIKDNTKKINLTLKDIPLKNILKGKEEFNTINIRKPGTYLVTGCVHVPWHNKAMYNSIFKFLKDNPVEGVVLAGDFLDLNSLSAYDRGSIPIPGVTLAMEYSQGNKFLNQLESCLPKDSIKVFLYGNHEDRYNRLKRNVDSYKYGTALISPIEGLNLKRRSYSIITDWKQGVVSMGRDLDVIHGEIVSVYSAKKTIDVYKKSTLFFHTHRTQTFIEGDIAGYNAGAGADFSSSIFSYATRAMKQTWSNGAALVTIDNEGYSHVEVLSFKNNKLCIGGKLY